jgi:hypothetical protein
LFESAKKKKKKKNNLKKIIKKFRTCWPRLSSSGQAMLTVHGVHGVQLSLLQTKKKENKNKKKKTNTVL